MNAKNAMSLDEIETLAKELIDHHLKHSGWSFSFDRSKQRMGCTDFRTKTISASKYLFSIPENANENLVKDTILHEIAHAVVGQHHGHDRIWQSAAKVLGCDPIRCYQAEKVVAVKPNFRYTCPSCNYSFTRFRRSKKADNAACGICCKGKFNSEYKFIVTYENPKTTHK